VSRAVIYVRVSSREQAEGGYSIDAQLEACRRFVTEKGWAIEEEFTELGESARTANRTASSAMVAFLEEHGAITHLVVHKIDRLARNLADYAATKARCKKLGVRLVSVTEGMEESSSGRLVEGIMATIAEFYSDNLSHEVRKGMHQKLKNGGWPHLAPVGYVNVRVNNGGRRDESVLAIDPAQGPLMIKAFELYASGNFTVTSLHQHMSELGLRNKRGTALSRAKFAELLHNKLYAGVVVHDGVEYPGAHEPLVSKELFARVQDTFLLHDWYKVRERKRPNHLRGFMVCGSCGSLLSSMNARGRSAHYPYFFCLGRFSRRTDCKERFLPEAEVETIVEQVYAGLRLTARDEKHLRAALEREMANEVTFAGESLALNRKHLARATAERERLLAAYLGQAIDLPMFKREQARLSREIEQAEATIARAEADDSPTKSSSRPRWTQSATPARPTPRPTPTRGGSSTGRCSRTSRSRAGS
jgi:site-specific DNA recombinase